MVFRSSSRFATECPQHAKLRSRPSAPRRGSHAEHRPSIELGPFRPPQGRRRPPWAGPFPALNAIEKHRRERRPSGQNRIPPWGDPLPTPPPPESPRGLVPRGDTRSLSRILRRPFQAFTQLSTGIEAVGCGGRGCVKPFGGDARETESLAQGARDDQQLNGAIAHRRDVVFLVSVCELRAGRRLLSRRESSLRRRGRLQRRWSAGSGGGRF